MGFLSILFRLIVAIGLGMYIYGTIVIIIRNYRLKKDPENKKIIENPINLLLILACFIFLLIISQIKLNFNFDGTIRQNINFTVISIFIAIGITFLVSQILKRMGKIPENMANLVSISEDQKNSEENNQKLDRDRKSNHLLAFGVALAAILIGIVTVYILLFFTDSPYYGYFIEKAVNFWDREDGTSFLQNTFNVDIFSTSRTILSITYGGFAMLLTTIEYSRLSRNIYFPFQNVVQNQLRYEEKDAIGSYVYMIVALAVCSVLLSTSFFLSVVSVVSFGDSAASLVGMRFGKRKYKHNNKTLEGTIAGGIVSLIFVFLFSGIYYAIAATIIFVIIDLITPKPFKLNDNILLPLILTGVIILLFVLGVPANSLFEYLIQ